jgi:anionic cell wall polymer biosynthesis LytR-Cps2A-Psr (LCP) family protein
MVDLVGGVEIYVPKRMKYTDRRGGLFIDFKPGRRMLDGYDAMCFVRYRHGDSDFKRQDRQKDFMLAFREAALEHPTQIPKIANKAVDVLGKALTAEELASLVMFARGIASDNISLGMVPTVPASGSDLRVDSSQLEQVLRDHHLIEDASRVSYGG